jgi:hypothetical protein
MAWQLNISRRTIDVLHHLFKISIDKVNNEPNVIINP